MKPKLGIWNVLPDENLTFQLPQYFDFIYVDLEHGFRSISELLTTIRFYNTNGVDFSVRVRRFDDPLIQTLLDSGVRNFILPQLRSIKELEIVKSSIQFPPHGIRGLHPKSNLKINSALNEDVSITVIVETKEALDLVENLAKESIVKDIYFGSYDLSMDLELKDGPFSIELEGYFQAVNKVCKTFGKNLVVMLPNRSDMSFARINSLNKVVVGIDSILVEDMFDDLTSKLRGT